MHLNHCLPVTKAAIRLSRSDAERRDVDAWQAHIDAGRIGAGAPRAGEGEFGCAGLARAFGLPQPE